MLIRGFIIRWKSFKHFCVFCPVSDWRKPRLWWTAFCTEGSIAFLFSQDNLRSFTNPEFYHLQTSYGKSFQCFSEALQYLPMALTFSKKRLDNYPELPSKLHICVGSWISYWWESHQTYQGFAKTTSNRATWSLHYHRSSLYICSDTPDKCYAGQRIFLYFIRR